MLHTINTLQSAMTSNLTSTVPFTVLLGTFSTVVYSVPKNMEKGEKLYNKIQMGQERQRVVQFHEVMTVHVSNRHTHGETGRWENVLGYS